MTVFALTGMKGGVGKTSSTVNLAWLAAKGGSRTLLWDLDPQGAASFLYRIEPKVTGGGKSLLRERGALEAAIKGTDHPGLDLLPADFSYRKLDFVLEESRDPAGRIARVLGPLAGEYDCVFLDCPPGLSGLSESVIAAADCLLVPTIPTVLSLRALARLLKHLKEGHEGLRILYFFCMVDRRRGLHREVCDWARQQGLGFLDEEIPYASIVEQMSVRRSPLGEWAERSEAAQAYARLWAEVCSRLQEPALDVSKRVRSQLKDYRPASRPAREAATAERAPRGPREQVEIEFKLRVDGEAAFEELARAALGRVPDDWRRSTQVNHFFDTEGGLLRRSGFVLRLREEAGEALLTAKGLTSARAAEDTLTTRAELEAPLEPAVAAAILEGRTCPLATLAQLVGERAPLLESLVSSASGHPLRWIGSFTNERRRVGPVHLANGDGECELVLEMDATTLPGGRVDYEVEAEVEAGDAEACGRGLERLFAKAGLPWRSAPSKAQRFFEALERQRT